MSSSDCATIRERIPDVAADRADGTVRTSVETHVSACEECAAELRLARSVARTKPPIPVDLSERVVVTLRRTQRPIRHAGWGLAAAAVAALALGIGITSRPARDALPDVGELAIQAQIEAREGELWLSDDGIVAGAPVLETLSDEALAELLEELTPSVQGGQA